jgi:hypothetical protein
MLTPQLIDSVVSSLPIQGRIILRLLLLQYLDVTPEDIGYMAADRPDPRLQAGGKLQTPYVSRETLQGITDRVAQYRTHVRKKRERAWLQIECLQKLIAMTEFLQALAEKLLTSRFGMDPESIQGLKKTARTAIPKPALRELNQRWEKGEVTEESYRKERLALEYQYLARKLERERKRLGTAQREFELANSTSLQDHEICQIWGIPAGSLAARKVKYLHQYLQDIQAQVRSSRPSDEPVPSPPIDLWKETWSTLARQPIQRSVALYDGLEGTEAALLDKLAMFAAGTFSEEAEGRFWLSLGQDSRPAAEYGATPHSLFALQKLYAILNEMDRSQEALQEELLARIAPAPKAEPVKPLDEDKAAELKLGEMGEHVLRSFMGEAHPDLQGRR